jgi:triacylglycerol lipase
MLLSAAAAADDYGATRYPIVLAHGASGWDELFGVYQYWYGIPAALEEAGAEVYVTQVSQLATTEERGEQLLAQIEEIVAITGAPRVNLIGHSHGGLDSRYVAAVRPDLVASVTTVGTPHRGAEAADFLRANVKEGSFSEAVLRIFAERLVDVLALLSGTRNEQDAIGAIESLTSEGMAAFNALYPHGVPETPCGEGAAEVDGVRFFSWSGNRWLTNVLDPSTVLFGLTNLLYSEPSDGLVGQCSSRFGVVIRDDYRMNHADQVNQVLGLTHLFGPNPRSLYRIHANRLREQGL